MIITVIHGAFNRGKGIRCEVIRAIMLEDRLCLLRGL